MTTVLRPYQLDAVTQIRQHAALRGKGAILQLPTGSGKTAIFCNLLKGAYDKGRRGMMVVRGKALVHQASERLRREMVPHGVFQGSNTKDSEQRVLVCSIDTLYARRHAPPADLLVIDECHLAHGEGYRWLFAQYPDSFKLGVSATPHNKSGMRHLGDRLIRTASFVDLVGQGYLVGARYFVPYIPNLLGLKKSGGDFNVKELGDKSRNDAELTANAARVWDKHLRGQSTFAYAVNLEHAKVLAEAIRAVGARVETVSASTPDGARRDYLRGLEDGAFDVLVSVGVLTTGVDLPSLRAILCCRPTESYNLWIQILGRGTRPFPGKENFLVYDLAGNLQRHGPIEAELIADLAGHAEPAKIRIKTCPECYATFEAGPEVCPACGASLLEVKARETGKRLHGLSEIEEVTEIVVEPWEVELPQLVAWAKEKQLRKGWIYHTLRGKHGEQAADKAWPRIRRLKKWPVRARATMPA